MADPAKLETKAASKTRRNIATNAGLVEIQIQYRSVVDLVLDPRNPRQHSQRQINQIADSIREFGFIAPVVVDHAAQVVIGHARVLAAKKLDMPQIPVVEIRHLSKAQVKALRIADNRLAQNAHWDERLLAEGFLELKELDIEFDLSITGFSLPEIDLTLQVLDDTKTGLSEDEELDATTGVPVCKTGDVWQLGDHRLHCGDATSEIAFDILMKEEVADVVFVDGRARERRGDRGLRKDRRDGFAGRILRVQQSERIQPTFDGGEPAGLLFSGARARPHFLRRRRLESLERYGLEPRQPIPAFPFQC
jgi:ParB-like nuclease domain